MGPQSSKFHGQVDAQESQNAGGVSKRLPTHCQFLLSDGGSNDREFLADSGASYHGISEEDMTDDERKEVISQPQGAVLAWPAVLYLVGIPTYY